MDTPEPSGVLVVRLWIEGRTELRARIIRSADLSPEQETVVASSVDDILAVVRDFIEGFVSSHSSHP